ncbi:hypothetical protein BU16DRAFT_554068 [Lophium mytilinum]|uniref:Uncharacterized protein n=1 Tax=Lophium mytilinum TaxID=390894 RepID=A0A6A6RB30_9PEZI|nr:hypothetical protein BU16DRAFT_554068 [Lophium mytilinum]
MAGLPKRKHASRQSEDSQEEQQEAGTGRNNPDPSQTTTVGRPWLGRLRPVKGGAMRGKPKEASHNPAVVRDTENNKEGAEERVSSLEKKSKEALESDAATEQTRGEMGAQDWAERFPPTYSNITIPSEPFVPDTSVGQDVEGGMKAQDWADRFPPSSSLITIPSPEPGIHPNVSGKSASSHDHKRVRVTGPAASSPRSLSQTPQSALAFLDRYSGGRASPIPATCSTITIPSSEPPAQPARGGIVPNRIPRHVETMRAAGHMPDRGGMRGGGRGRGRGRGAGVNREEFPIDYGRRRANSLPSAARRYRAAYYGARGGRNRPARRDLGPEPRPEGGFPDASRLLAARVDPVVAVDSAGNEWHRRPQRTSPATDYFRSLTHAQKAVPTPTDRFSSSRASPERRPPSFSPITTPSSSEPFLAESGVIPEVGMKSTSYSHSRLARLTSSMDRAFQDLTLKSKPYTTIEDLVAAGITFPDRISSGTASTDGFYEAEHELPDELFDADVDVDFDYGITGSAFRHQVQEDVPSVVTFNWQGLPPELQRWVIRKRLGTGATLRQRWQRGPHSNGVAFRRMTTEHSFDDQILSDYMLGSLVSPEFRQMHKEEFWWNNILDVEDCDLLTRTITYLTSSGANSQLRDVIIGSPHGTDIDGLKSLLLEETGLRRLSFPMRNGYDVMGGARHFELVAFFNQDHIMEVFGDFLVRLRRARGKKNLTTDFLPNLDAAYQYHEERVRRHKILKKSDVEPLNEDEIAESSKSIMVRFEDLLEAREEALFGAESAEPEGERDDTPNFPPETEAE